MPLVDLLESINYAAVVVAAVVGLAIGFVWYMPPVLGRRWAGFVSRYTGATEHEVLNPDPRVPLTGWAAGMLLNAFVLAVLTRGLAAQSAADALLLGLLVWIGFGATFSSWPVLFAKQPLGLWVVNNGAFLMMQLTMALIVTLWR